MKRRSWRRGLLAWNLIGSLALAAYLAWSPAESQGLRLATTELDLGEVPCGGRLVGRTRVENPGVFRHSIRGWTSTRPELEAAVEQIELAPGAGTDLIVGIRGQGQPGRRDGVLTLNTEAGPVALRVTADEVFPCLPVPPVRLRAPGGVVVLSPARSRWPLEASGARTDMPGVQVGPLRSRGGSLEIPLAVSARPQSGRVMVSLTRPAPLEVPVWVEVGP
jgi:hypothetical protein